MRFADHENVAAHTNYDDDIFFVQALVKSLKAGLTLEIDADLFRDKVIEDILFADGTLARIYQSLDTNRFLVRRAEYLRDLLRAKRAFADFLEEITSGRLSFSSELESVRSTLTEARIRHVREIADIQTAMDQDAASPEPQDIVSQDEFRFLLKPEEGDEET